MFDDRVHQAGLTSHAVVVIGIETAPRVPHGVVAVEELVLAGLDPSVRPPSGLVIAPDG